MTRELRQARKAVKEERARAEATIKRELKKGDRKRIQLEQSLNTEKESLKTERESLKTERESWKAERESWQRERELWKIGEGFYCAMRESEKEKAND